MSKELTISEENIKIAMIAKALAHPARVRIIEILAQRKSCICGEIVDLMPLSQSTVSQHLKELKQAGLIDGEVNGPRICYCLNKDVFESAGRTLDNLFTNCCC